MTPNIRLIDPQGRTHAVLPSPATPEALLRAAFDLRAEDGLLVCMVGVNEWSLAIHRSGGQAQLTPVGPVVPEVSRSQWDSMRQSMAETAWLDLIDAGWGVVRVDDRVEAASLR